MSIVGTDKPEISAMQNHITELAKVTGGSFLNTLIWKTTPDALKLLLLLQNRELGTKLPVQKFLLHELSV